MRSQLLQALCRAPGIMQHSLFCCQQGRPAGLQAWQQLGSRTCCSTLHNGNPSSSSGSSSGGGGGGRHMPLWPAVALGAGALSLAAASPSLADSSSMQMQQTQAAANSAAKSAAQHEAGAGLTDGGSVLSSDPDSGSVGSILEYLGAATDYVATLVEDTGTRLSGLLEQTSDQPVAVRLLAFAAALLPVILASGLAYKYASGSSLAAALYKMYCLLIRVEAGAEPNLRSYLVTHGVFLIGFFTLAVLLGVVNDEVQKRADDHRFGRNPVKASDHVLVLNWNENTPALLQNIAVAVSSAAEAKAEAGLARGAALSAAGGLWSKDPAVVVLADKSKAEMDAAVQEVIRDRGFNLTVHTRQGQPFRPSQLKKVAAHQAAIVVLLHPEGAPTPADAEALKAAAAMAFTTLPARDGDRHRKQQRMVVQMPASVPSAGNVLRSVQDTSARAAGSSNLHLQVLSLPDKTLTNRLVAQTAAQPGLLTVWLDILAPTTRSSNFMCLETPPDMEQGMTYRDIRRSFSEDIVVGYIEPSGAMQLNPAETAVPGPGSKLVLLTNGTGQLSTARNRLQQQESSRHVYERAAEAAAARLRRGARYRYQPRHIVVASWADSHLQELVRSFAEFAPVGSTVCIISQQDPARPLPKRLGNVSRFELLKHPHPTSLEALQAAGIAGADCVVLGTGSGHPTDAEADARVLAGLLQLQDAVMRLRLPKAPHVVAPICETGSSSMALRYLDKLTQQQNLDAQSAQATRAATSWGWRQADNDTLAVLKPEFLIFRNITSAVVAQAASETHYADVIASLLFSREGQESYLRPPASFNIPLQQPISFAEVQELARQTGQTALGYITTDVRQSAGDDAAEATCSSSVSPLVDGGGDSRRAGVQRLLPWVHSVTQKLSRAATVHLGLSATQQVVLKEGDWIVVLAEDF